MEKTGKQRGRKRTYASISESLEVKRNRDRKRNASKVNIGNALLAWTNFKKKHRCTTHAEVALLLLSRFRSVRAASTPKPDGASLPCTPGLSIIDGQDASRTLTASVVSEACNLPESPIPRQNNNLDVSEKSMVSLDELEISDPLGIQTVMKGDETWTPSKADIYTSESESESNTGSDDEVDESSSDHEDDDLSLDLLTDGDIVFNTADCDDHVGTDLESEEEEDRPSLMKKIPTAASAQSVVNEEKCIAFKSSLELLARTVVPVTCSNRNCNSSVSFSSTQKGSALVITWKCEDGHIVHKWSSQPYLAAKGTNAGDFLIASNILLSGNNYQKMSLFFNFMKVGIISLPTFDRIQREFCFPAIEDLWKRTLDTTWKKLRAKGAVVLAGDGRNDSPGFSAMYCTYTLIDHDTKEIVYMNIVDKRMTQGNSPKMEKEALREGLQYLQKKKIPVKELVTDANASVAAMMKGEFGNIQHQFDLWHGAKNLGKKIQAAAKEKGNAALLPWKRKITNHFWSCSEKCTSQLQLMGMWTGLLNHIVDIHEWTDVLGSGETECRHEAIDENDREVQWLEAESKPHEALRAIVLETRLINTLKYYVNFRHTGFLETFHSHILMYSSKRFSFTWPSYKARNTLAALDWQFHNGRQDKVKKNGEPVYMRHYSKNSNRWTVSRVKEAKTYPHIPGLLEDIVQRRMTFNGKTSKAERLPEDPRWIAPSIAPIPAPSTLSLVLEHKSRFSM